MRAAWSLAGRTVLITGAARGIGAETARRLAARGARVALVGLEPEHLAEVANGIGGAAAWWEADVTDSASLEAAVAGAVERFGGIDAVVANAGVANYGTVLTAHVDEFVRTIDVNLSGVYRTVAATVDQLVARRGYLLIVASVASYTPLPGGAAYAASKAGVDSLTASLRLELDRCGVGVGSAHPCWIDTDMVRGAEAAMPSFAVLRGKLPWPARSVTSVEACGAALAAGVERRAARIYVPRSAALISGVRALIMNPKVQEPSKRALAADLDRLDGEVAAMRKRVQQT